MGPARRKCGATRTCGGAAGADTDPRGCLCGAKDANEAYSAHAYSRPGKMIGGRTKAKWATQMHKAVSLIYLIILIIFFRVGQTTLSAFASDVTSRGLSDQIAVIDTR